MEAIKAWLNAGCPAATEKSEICAAFTPAIAFSHIVDVVLGRGIASHLHADEYPPC